MNKYKAKKTRGYDSKREADRATVLKLKQRAGLISDLKEQVRFELIPAQYAVVDGKKKCIEKSCHYVADFTYTDNEGKFIVEDSKGFKTDVYKIKKKLMFQKFSIQIKET